MLAMCTNHSRHAPLYKVTCCEQLMSYWQLVHTTRGFQNAERMCSPTKQMLRINPEGGIEVKGEAGDKCSSWSCTRSWIVFKSLAIHIASSLQESVCALSHASSEV